MDGARLSRYPHLSWLNITYSLRAGSPAVGIHLRSVTHGLSMTLKGRHAVRWICRGDELKWEEFPGTVHFRPCNGQWQDFVIRSAESGDVAAFFMPPNHLEDMARGEGVEGRCELQRLLLRNDAVIQRAMLTLAACQATADDSAGRADEAARRLVLRLMELCGGGAPDWNDDESVFDARVLRHLVSIIDEHLREAPTLSDMGLLVGLSPSHFGRKFRNSTGLSLHRFVNRRRVHAALHILKTNQSQSLAHVALDLGFSSQSHLTRLFSGLTGMTPAKYRKHFRRTVG